MLKERSLQVVEGPFTRHMVLSKITANEINYAIHCDNTLVLLGFIVSLELYIQFRGSEHLLTYKLYSTEVLFDIILGICFSFFFSQRNCHILYCFMPRTRKQFSSRCALYQYISQWILIKQLFLQHEVRFNSQLVIYPSNSKSERNMGILMKSMGVIQGYENMAGFFKTQKID